MRARAGAAGDAAKGTIADAGGGAWGAIPSRRHGHHITDAAAESPSARSARP